MIFRWSTVPSIAVAASMFLSGCAVSPSLAFHRASWMSHEAAASDLLYVSASSSDVYVLTYPQYRLVGILTGFAEVTGVCSDAGGNVWVGNSGRSTLVEYAHGGSVPIATLSDPNAYPISCAVDPKSGDLAVANLPFAGPANIAIYPRASGSPTIYSNQDFSEILYLTYGPHAAIYFDGINGIYFGMGRLFQGRYTTLHVRGAKITSSPEGVQYVQGMLTTTAHQNGSTALIYQMSTSGVIEHTIRLGNAYLCNGYLIWQSVIVCPSAGYDDLRVYAYPQGGRAIADVLENTAPIQAAMSVAQPRP